MQLSSGTIWRLALQYSLPVAMGYYPAGIAFGVLMTVAGLPLWLTALTSLVLYSGAAQYAAIPMLAAGASIATMLINTLAINLRHIFYAIPLLPQLPSSRLGRIYSYFALTDESFSLLTTIDQSQRQALMLPIVCLNQFYWVSASIIGAVIGGQLNQLIPHLDFALVCLFVVLLFEQLSNKGLFWPLLVAAIAYLLATLVTPAYPLLVAIGLCALFSLLEVRLPLRWRISAQPAVWSAVGGSIWLALGYCALSSTPDNSHNDSIFSGEPLSAIWLIIAVFVMGGVTFLTRAAPALIPVKWFQSDLLQALNQSLPISVLLVLIFHSLNPTAWLLQGSALFPAELVAIFCVALSYSLKRNVLLAMVIGISSLNLALYLMTAI